MESDRNIAELVRNGGSFYAPPEGIPKDGIGIIPAQTMCLIPALGFEEDSVSPTRNGQWQTYARSNWTPGYFSPRDAVAVNSTLAIYFKSQKEGEPLEPRTLFLSDLSVGSNHYYFDDHLHAGNIQDTLDVLTLNIIEQKESIRLPRKLNEREKNQYNFNRNLFNLTIGAGLIGLYGVDQYFGNFTSGLLWQEDAPLPDILLYANELLPLAASIKFLSILFPRHGGLADTRRIKHLPIYADDFKYGPEAIETLSQQHAIMMEEQRKKDIYAHLTQTSQISVPKDVFEGIYAFMANGQSRDKMTPELHPLITPIDLRFNHILQAFASFPDSSNAQQAPNPSR
ncbi:MAG TPA: hypothetical protein VJB12_02490 [Candidatus Nanoarchaeia archaeon]|nr:hypothetical protein [Candidatus Nanoarchaeia archaeon]